MTLKKQYIRAKSFFIEWARTLDRGLLWAILAVIICGIFLTFSASPAVSNRTYGDPFVFIKKQLVFLQKTVIVKVSFT